MQATAVINHCHEPIDITFILQSSHDYNVSLTHFKSWIGCTHTVTLPPSF